MASCACGGADGGVACEVQTDDPQGRVRASLHEAFDDVAARFSERPAVEDAEGAWSYAELADRSWRVAAGLVSVDASTVPAACGKPRPVATLVVRGRGWVATCLGAMRIGSPTLGLSIDLGVREEKDRNKQAVLELSPWVLVVDDAGAASAQAPICECPSIALDRLLSWQLPPGFSHGRGAFARASRSADDPLYYLYTGGSTGASKCVIVTHRMALHEVDAYPTVVDMDSSHRLLQQSSVYWGATALGFFDIAWAFGACLVVARDVRTPEHVADAVRRYGVTVVGVVPSVLEAWDPADLPTLQVAFTWGEALSQRTVDRWCQHAVLLDLLIASEYWLAFVANHSQRTPGGGRAPFRVVRGVLLALRDPDTGEHLLPSRAVADEAVAELYVAGPMVTSLGYADSSKNSGVFELFSSDAGKPPLMHYRTRDLVTLCADGTLVYRGRADGYAKIGGRWVDVSSLEGSLREAGCSEAAVVWHGDLHLRQAAVVVDHAHDTGAGSAGPLHGATWSAWTGKLRRLLPGDTRLDILTRLARHPATGKVHRAELARGLTDGMVSTQHAEQRLAAFGLALAAAATGGLGASLLPAMWALVPCRKLDIGSRFASMSGSASALGFGKQLRQWISWQRALAMHLTASALTALPWIALALLDHEALGLSLLSLFVHSPLGHLGTALWLCRRYPATWRPVFACLGARNSNVFATTGVARAQFELDSNCGVIACTNGSRSSGWPWIFWMGLPSWGDEWAGTSWRTAKNGAKCGNRAGFALRSLADMDVNSACSVQWCAYCSTLSTEGETWKNWFYCEHCWNSWPTEVSSNGYSGRAAADTIAPGAREDGRQQSVSELANGDAAAAEMPVAGGTTSLGPPPKLQKLWRPGVDHISIADDVLERAAKLVNRAAPDASRVTTNGSAAGNKSKVEAVVERCTGLSGLQESLSGLESLKVLALLNALRRELHVSISVREMAACDSVGDLVELCKASTASEATAEDNGELPATGGGDCADSPMYFMPRFFNAPVSWLLRLDSTPVEASLRTAARQLVKRHEALRMAAVDSDAVVEYANAAAPWFGALREALGSHFSNFLSVVGLHCYRAWPRVRVRDCEELSPTEMEAHFEWLWFDQLDDLMAAAKLRRRSRGFTGPIQMTMLSLRPHAKIGNGDEVLPQHYLLMAVNHAAVDGACMMPLFHDLSAFHTAAQSGTADIKLPTLPSPITMLGKRLRAALVGEGEDAIDFTQGTFAARTQGYDHFVVLDLSASRLLELASRSIGVPTDHLIVASIVCAYARVSGLREVRVTAIVPMRDGPGESNMVGNIAGTRCIYVPVAYRSLVGVALEISRRLRLRLWSPTPVPDDEMGIFLNVRTCPAFPGASVISDVVDFSVGRTQYVGCALGMYVDQDPERGWILSAGIRCDLEGSKFAYELRSVLIGFGTAPCLEAAPVTSRP